MSTPTSPQYPFDPTGTKTTNRVVGELQPLTGIGDRDFYTIVPAAAPFYADTFKMKVKTLQGQIVPLNEGVDFYFTHEFIGATRATAKAVYASVTFLNAALRGTLIIDPYQCVGGDWSVDSNTIAKVLADRVNNPRTIAWEQVAGYPTIFPPVPHEWNLMDMVGQSEMVAALNRVVDAILVRAADAVNAHINDMSGKAHGITPGSIGAVSLAQLKAEVSKAITAATATTDSIKEGTTNKFFTGQRVLDTVLASYALTEGASDLSQQDTVLKAFNKLMGNVVDLRNQVSKKVNTSRPHFTGLPSQELVKLVFKGPSLSIDVTTAGAYQIAIQGNGSIGFDVRNLGDITNRVFEFSVTTVNATGTTQYAIAWPANVDWVEGEPPPRTTTPGARDSWYFWTEDGGVTWVGSLSNKDTV